MNPIKPERWQQIDQLLEAALECPPVERAAFLASACEGDEVLRREVESLLRADGRAGTFIEAPAVPLTAEVLAAQQARVPTGEQLGHYKVLSPLGRGGMGEVYLAEDMRLGRKVALKLLPAGLAADEEARRRFTREARAASALNHSHIITIYDVGSDSGLDFIAMEYVDGESLRSLLLRGKVELKRTLELMEQCAAGLAAAHAAGIFHRDIKPENLMVTPAGKIKILDFGLAKLAETQRSSILTSDLSTLPAAAAQAATNPGVILGTVAYMSPEQALGQKVDARTDIFSLGVVLYEMITGQRPFQGKSTVDTLHAIINQEPRQALEVNPRLPVEVLEILSKALAKQVSERYQHAGDFELDLRRLRRAIESNSLISAKVQTMQPTTPGAATGTRQQKWLWACVAVLALGLTGGGAWWLGRLTGPSARTLALEHFAITPLTTDAGYEGDPTFAPDGRSLAYTSDRTGNFEVFLKQVAGGPDLNLTNNAADDVQPAFSPDGQQIAFVSSRGGGPEIGYNAPDSPMLGGGIWVMPALGGSARRIAERGNFPAWSPDGTTIIYTSGTWFRKKIYRVAAVGGEASEIPVQLPAGQSQPPHLFYPSYSPGGRWILFGTSSTIYLLPAEGGPAQQLAQGSYPVWRANGKAILYSSGELGKNRALWQLPFAAGTGKVTGVAEPLTVGRGSDVQPTVSRDDQQVVFTAMDQILNLEVLPFDAEQGRVQGEPLALTNGNVGSDFHSFSPDGKSVVYDSKLGGSASHLWRIDRGGVPVQLTSDPKYFDASPKWAPDGNTIAFQRQLNESSDGDLWLIAADGANPRRLKEKTGVSVGGLWLPDGRSLVYFSFTDRQLYYFELATKIERRLTDEAGIMPVIALSQDGQWVAYQSTQNGNVDIRVVPMDGGPSRAVVTSPREDFHPFFSPSGQWLYYQPGHKNLARVPGPAQQWRQAPPEKVTNFAEAGIYLEDFQTSGDGRQLLYSRGRMGGDLWLLKVGK